MYRYLCPICLRKLQSVLKFNVKTRFENMLAVCKELGFNEYGKYYEKMLKEVMLMRRKDELELYKLFANDAAFKASWQQSLERMVNQPPAQVSL